MYWCNAMQWTDAMQCNDLNILSMIYKPMY